MSNLPKQDDEYIFGGRVSRVKVDKQVINIDSWERLVLSV